MRIAIIENDRVTRVVKTDDDWQDVLSGVHAVPSQTANIGDVWDGAAFTAPPSPAPTKADLMAHAAERRWLVEAGGITIFGFRVATDDASQTKILGARIAAEANAAFATRWVDMDGGIHTLTATMMIAVSNAVLAHIAGAFDVFSSVVGDIESGAITTLAQIDAAAWPKAAPEGPDI